MDGVRPTKSKFLFEATRQSTTITFSVRHFPGRTNPFVSRRVATFPPRGK